MELKDQNLKDIQRGFRKKEKEINAAHPQKESKTTCKRLYPAFESNPHASKKNRDSSNVTTTHTPGS